MPITRLEHLAVFMAADFTAEDQKKAAPYGQVSAAKLVRPS